MLLETSRMNYLRMDASGFVSKTQYNIYKSGLDKKTDDADK